MFLFLVQTTQPSVNMILPAVFFFKTSFFRQRVKLYVFATFNVIIRKIFLKNLIKYLYVAQKID